MRKLLYLLFLVLILPVFAEEALLVSTVNYPDTQVARVISKVWGIPIFFVDQNTITSDLINDLQSNNITTVYLIGGPAVISEDIESELNQTFEVTRLWGLTRYGTAIEVMKYFFTNASKAVIVEDWINGGKSKLTLLGAIWATKNKVPFFLSPTDEVPSDLIEALNDLNVSEIVLIGDFSQEYINELQENGFDISQKFNKEEIKERIRERLGSKEKLIVIAVANWTNTLVPERPDSDIYLVSSENEIPELISFIKEKNYSKIFVLGKPDLAQIIVNQLEENGINVTHTTANPKKLAREWFRENKEKIKAIWREKIKERFKENVKRKLRIRLERSCEIAINRTNSIINFLEEENKTNLVEIAQNHLQRIQNLCENTENLTVRELFRREARVRGYIEKLNYLIHKRKVLNMVRQEIRNINRVQRELQQAKQKLIKKAKSTRCKYYLNMIEKFKNRPRIAVHYKNLAEKYCR